MIHDLVIKNGLIVDGTGNDPFEGTVAVDGDRISAIGPIDASGTEEISADGRIVTPGFIDLHTHLDAQVAWEPLLTPSSWHGVTTVLIGNCGVTFAPCKPGDSEFLAGMMAAVEHVPEAAILDKLSWDWESYGGYLDAIAAYRPALNIAGLVGHATVRFHVMGARSVAEPANADERERIADVVDQSLRDGAIGFSTSRYLGHYLHDGRHIPGTYAEPRELLDIARVVGKHDRVLQFILNFEDLDTEMGLLADAARPGGRVLFSAVVDFVELMRERVQVMRASGLDVSAITLPRRGAMVSSLESGVFWRTPAWGRIQQLDPAGRLAAIHDRATCEQLVADVDADPEATAFSSLFYWLGAGDTPNYARPTEDNLLALAQTTGEHPVAAWLRMARETDGRALFQIRQFNGDIDALRQMLQADWVTPGLSDAGAHVDLMMDAGWPTFVLSHWHRDTGVFSLSEAVRRIAAEPARILGLRDRGTLAVGQHADLNVIDLGALAERMPAFVHDLPGGTARWVQRARGYCATVCNGEVILRDDELTGVRPGRVVRGTRSC
ncbi:MAG: amidohydrolase family protein [Planctomycetota bacterium]